LTANDFAANESWKFWASECVERGSKLVIAQHGGSYGSAAYLATEAHEIAISDRFLTWGWTSESNSKVYKAPAMKLMGLKNYRAKNSGFCLLVTTNLPRRSYHLGSWPIGPQLGYYFQDQFDFVSNLSSEVRKNLAVRLFPHDNGWEQHARWNDFDSEIKLLPVSNSLSEFLNSTKLYIATNNATTFLESFVSGIPTIVFWDKIYWEINENAKPYFKILQEAKIFFDTPREAAMHVNSVWQDIPSWWNSEEVKMAVKLFSDRFAYTGEKPFAELKSAILNWN
jgi:putative transferase (TIGR04331 family)